MFLSSMKKRLVKQLIIGMFLDVTFIAWGVYVALNQKVVMSGLSKLDYTTFDIWYVALAPYFLTYALFSFIAINRA